MLEDCAFLSLFIQLNYITQQARGELGPVQQWSSGIKCTHFFIHTSFSISPRHTHLSQVSIAKREKKKKKKKKATPKTSPQAIYH